MTAAQDTPAGALALDAAPAGAHVDDVAKGVPPLCDADTHTLTVEVINLRAGHVIVDAADPHRWPPTSPVVWTRTWARVQGLLPW